jgi:pimeloyl-ACP methyl ester carboxylesterase
MKIDIGGGVRLFVDVEGPEWVADGPTLRQKPTLICLHGGPGFDHSGFKPIFSRLADLVQIIYYDHRGHGRSDERPRAEWTLDTWADDVVRLCDALGIEKPIVLGQSFGGFVAQHYLARHPGHASKVILSSTAPNMRMARKLAMFEKLGGAPARELAEAFWSKPTPANWAAYWAGCRTLYNSTAPRDPFASQRTLLREDILLHFVDGETRSMDLLAGLALAQCPVLVMAGEDDPVCPLADARDMAAALPAPWSELVSFPGVGHGAWRDDPEAAFATLRRFIQA